MASYPRSMLQLAVTTIIASVLWTAAPAVAAESPGEAVAASAQTPPAQTAPARTAASMVKRHAPRENRTAAFYYDRRTTPIHASLECLGFWCGRQFVLMLGVGY